MDKLRGRLEMEASLADAPHPRRTHPRPPGVPRIAEVGPGALTAAGVRRRRGERDPRGGGRTRAPEIGAPSLPTGCVVTVVPVA